MNKAAAIVGLIASGSGLFVGSAVGYGVAEANGATPPPEVITETVTEEVEVEVVKEVEVPIETTVVPQICLDALENGDKLTSALNDTTDFLVEVLSINERAFMAMAMEDWNSLEYESTQLENVSSEMNSAATTYEGVIPNFELAANQCRATEEGA